MHACIHTYMRTSRQTLLYIHMKLCTRVYIYIYRERERGIQDMCIYSTYIHIYVYCGLLFCRMLILSYTSCLTAVVCTSDLQSAFVDPDGIAIGS